MKLEPDDLRAVAIAIADVFAQRDATDAKLPAERLAFKEPEAAALLSIRPHVLRDMRLRGEITARRAGKCYLYSRQALLDWLDGRDAR